MMTLFIQNVLQIKNFLAKEMSRAAVMQNRIEKGRLDGILQNW